MTRGIPLSGWSCQLEQIWAFYLNNLPSPSCTALPLPSVTFGVAGVKLLTLSSRLLSLAASAQTLLATKLVSNVQAMAIFHCYSLKYVFPRYGFCFYSDLPEGRRQKKCLILADLPFFAPLKVNSNGGGASTCGYRYAPVSASTMPCASICSMMARRRGYSRCGN